MGFTGTLELCVFKTPVYQSVRHLELSKRSSLTLPFLQTLKDMATIKDEEYLNLPNPFYNVPNSKFSRLHASRVFLPLLTSEQGLCTFIWYKTQSGLFHRKMLSRSSKIYGSKKDKGNLSSVTSSDWSIEAGTTFGQMICLHKNGGFITAPLRKEPFKHQRLRNSSSHFGKSESRPLLCFDRIYTQQRSLLHSFLWSEAFSGNPSSDHFS